MLNNHRTGSPKDIGGHYSETSTRKTLILYLPKTQERLRIPINTKVILGRSSTDEGDRSFCVDFSASGGYELGVSRRHLMFVCDVAGDVRAFDLDSQNGSFLNGVRMSSHTGYLLHNGDRLKLGSLELHFYTSADDLPDKNTTPLQVSHHEHDETAKGQTRKLTLPNPKPDIRNTLEFKPFVDDGS